jgi:hypothetical protein
LLGGQVQDMWEAIMVNPNMSSPSNSMRLLWVATNEPQKVEHLSTNIQPGASFIRHKSISAEKLLKTTKVFHIFRTKVVIAILCFEKFRSKRKMKVGELRKKLSKMKKDEVIKIASEFYKLIPKSKKEDYALDSYVNKSGKKKKPSKTKNEISLEELELNVNTFIEDARNQYYFAPNTIIPKKERSKWRFKVKRWYKALTDRSRKDKDLKKQAKLLSDLYELLCESCAYIYFSGEDSFRSIGVEQPTFYFSVIHLLQESKGKAEALQPAIELIVNNQLNRYTLYSDLMVGLISTLDIPDLKYKGIEISEGLIQLNNSRRKPQKNKRVTFSSEDYRTDRKTNNLTELALRLYAGLYEVDEGINFFYKHYREEDEDVKLYVLVRILFQLRAQDNIVKEIEKAMNKGVKVRSRLVDLLDETKKDGVLPEYM